MLSLEPIHPFHSLTKLFESSIGIHIQPVINKSYRDQLEVLWNSKPGSGGYSAVTHGHQENGNKYSVNERVMGYSVS